MIEKLRIRGFKGFDELEVGPVSRVTILGGRNSVGKSSILEAIFLFFDRRNPELILRQFGWRGMNRVYLAADQLFTPIFHNYDLKQEITVSLTIGGVEERLCMNFSEKPPSRKVRFERLARERDQTLQVRTDDKPVVNAKLDIEYTRQGKNEHSTLFVTAKGLTLKDDNTRLDDRRAIYLSPRTPSAPHEDAQRFGELDVKGQSAIAVDFLKQFDPRIVGLTSVFYGDSSVIHADIGLDRKVPLPHLGEGLSSLLSIFLAAAEVKKGILLIDDIGTGIHHTLLPVFWRGVATATRMFDCQLICTTHSFECLLAAHEGLRDLFEPDFSYFRLNHRA